MNGKPITLSKESVDTLTRIAAAIGPTYGPQPADGSAEISQSDAKALILVGEEVEVAFQQIDE